MTPDRNFYYLLPTGDIVPDMKQGTEKMSQVKGYKISSKTFRHLIKVGVVKRLENNLLISIANSNDNNNTGETLNA